MSLPCLHVDEAVPPSADYIGCMKTGGIMRTPNLRWYEPQHELFGGQEYFTHAWGSIYVLSDHAARTLAKVSAIVPEGLRFFNNEGEDGRRNRARPAYAVLETRLCVLRAELVHEHSHVQT